MSTSQVPYVQKMINYNAKIVRCYFSTFVTIIYACTANRSHIQSIIASNIVFRDTCFFYYLHLTTFSTNLLSINVLIFFSKLFLKRHLLSAAPYKYLIITQMVCAAMAGETCWLFQHVYLQNYICTNKIFRAQQCILIYIHIISDKVCFDIHFIAIIMQLKIILIDTKYILITKSKESIVVCVTFDDV